MHPRSESWRTISVALAAAAFAATAVAVTHILATAHRGVICGLVTSGPEHCWACYGAPLLALAAIAAWRESALPAPIRARTR